MNEEERKAAIDKAGAAQFRIFSAWPLVIFGVVEQLIALLLTLAQGLTFVSLSVTDSRLVERGDRSRPPRCLPNRCESDK